MEFKHLCITVFLLAASVCFASDEVTVVVDGSSVIENEALAKAREDAKNDAYESAVRVALSSYYKPELIRKNESRLRLKVYSKSKNLVSGFKIKSEDRIGDTLKLKVEVVLNMKSLKDKLAESGISLVEGSSSKVLPLIVERTSASGGDYWWQSSSDGLEQRNQFSDVEQALAKYFTDKGLVLLDPYEHELSQRVPQSYRYMELKAPELINLGRIFDAELVSTGYIWTNCVKDDLQGVSDCETTFSLQILSIDTGRIVAAKKAVEKISDPDYGNARVISRARATKVVSDSLLSQLSKKWSKRPAFSFKVILSGLNNYSTYKNFREILTDGKIEGLDNVVERMQMENIFIFEGERRVDLQELYRKIYARFSADSKIEVKSKGEDFIEFKLL
ncbi:MAG: hypothetical protein JXA66_00485 [Oligoflexia bacterium]|nr:hypothetical protein [Oligoflexia bacterium]